MIQDYCHSHHHITEINSAYSHDNHVKNIQTTFITTATTIIIVIIIIIIIIIITSFYNVHYHYYHYHHHRYHRHNQHHYHYHLNKLATISYRNHVTLFKTQLRLVVSLQSFQHLEVISMVHKSTDHGKLLSICFFNNSF